MKLSFAAAALMAPVLLLSGATTDPHLRLLDLTVIALDNHSKPVTDLTADDFRITDAGKPQKISFFRRNAPHTDDPAASDAAPSHAAQFSNRASGSTHNAVVILFDLLNLGFGARGMAANEIVRALSGLESADSVYLYLVDVDGKVFAVRGIDPGAVPEPGEPWTRQIKSLLSSALRMVEKGRSPDIDVFFRIQLTFAALNTLGAQLSAIPGRKIVVWVSDGVPLELGLVRSDTGVPVDFTPQIRQLSEVFEQSRIALYPVRQIMLGRGDNIGAYSDGNGATGGADTGEASIATLDEFADMTGGRRSAGKDIGAAIRQAKTDLEYSYQIGYYPPDSNWNDKFHRLRVTSSRKGVQIQSKQGYYAWKVPPGARTREATEMAARTPFDAEEIGLRADVAPAAGSDGAATVNVHIDARNLALAREADSFIDRLSIVTIGYLPNGMLTTPAAKDVDLRYTAAQRDEVLRSGLLFREKLTATQGENQFRIIVLDAGSNSIGSLTIPAASLHPSKPAAGGAW